MAAIGFEKGFNVTMNKVLGTTNTYSQQDDKGYTMNKGHKEVSSFVVMYCHSFKVFEFIRKVFH